MEGFQRLLADIESGEIEVFARDTTQPSVFSHQVLNAMPYAFLDDAPLEERRSRAVALRRALPDDARDLASLDPQAIASASANAWPPMRDADELHDALLTLGMLTETDLSRGQRGRWRRTNAPAGFGPSLRMAVSSRPFTATAARPGSLPNA